MPSQTKYIHRYLAVHERRLAATLAIIPPLHPTRILEIGCYPPQALLFPLRRGSTVYGISSQFEPVTDPQVVQLNIESDPFPYPANFFDLVLFCEIIEHLHAYPPVAVLQKISIVLRPGGHLLITTPNRQHLKNLARAFVPHLPAPAGSEHSYSPHHHEYVLSELVSLLHSQNFIISRAFTADYYTPFRAKSRLENPALRSLKIAAWFLTQALPPIRDTLVVLAQKK